MDASEKAKAEADQAPKPKIKTQCNADIGVRDVGVQTSSKLAKRRHCLQPIIRGCTRIAWAYSRVKFHAWVHVKCFPILLQAESGDLNQAVNFLTTWQEQNRESPQALDVSDLLQALLNIQQEEPASTSGASSSRGF